MLEAPTVTNADKPLVTVDFTDFMSREIGADATLSSCATSIAVWDDSDMDYPDASPSSRLDSGTFAISSPYAQQRLIGLVEGADYVLSFVGTFSDGSKETIQVRVPCRKYV